MSIEHNFARAVFRVRRATRRNDRTRCLVTGNERGAVIITARAFFRGGFRAGIAKSATSPGLGRITRRQWGRRRRRQKRRARSRNGRLAQTTTSRVSRRSESARDASRSGRLVLLVRSVGATPRLTPRAREPVHVCSESARFLPILRTRVVYRRKLP